MEKSLYEALNAYLSQGLYPFHMPGHKRQLAPNPDLPYCWDVTEVPGTDDLHEAAGILKQAMDRTGRFWGSGRTWYLVNGSTCGLLAGIRALAPRGSTVIAARNCHKSVCHAIELGDLQVRWVMPRMLPEGICGPVDPEALARALAETPEAACVILTSPTYEGVLSDIGACAALCHERHIPLLVDEAHGAHLGHFPGWPESALHLGADLVVQSVHKTLPSLTQTALLHLGKDSLADPQTVERQLAIFETSSPSYPLLVSIDSCTRLMQEQGQLLFERWRRSLQAFDRQIRGLKHLKVLGHSENFPFPFDPGKLPVFTGSTDLRGGDLARILRQQYGLETEMSQGDICLAMTGLGEDPGALRNLGEALLAVDAGLAFRERTAALTLPAPGKAVCPLSQALTAPGKEIPLGEALGKTAGEAIWAYPPGIPLILPGEEITRAFLEAVRDLQASGTGLHGSRSRKGGITVV